LQEGAVKRLSAIASTVIMPIAGLRACFDARLRWALRERLPLFKPEFSVADAWPIIWLHGASVGELIGIEPVLAGLRKKYPRAYLSVSMTSDTGRERAKKMQLGDSAFMLPYDHPYFVGRVLGALKPTIFVCAETEIWPNLLFGLKDAEVPTLVVNGRVSDRSFPRYLKFRGFFAPLFSSLGSVLAQSELDAERFLALGVESERVSVAGSTKYDKPPQIVSDEDLAACAVDFGIRRDRACFVAGSVRPVEDEMIIEAYLKAAESVPGLQMIIAPRHPERFSAVADQLSAKNVLFRRRSGGRPADDSRVLLLDTMGELGRAYALSTAAFVGGTLVPIGGHNPLEPAAYRAPVMVGPYTDTVRDAIASLKRKGGVAEVGSADEISSLLIEVCTKPDKRKAMGEAAYAAWLENRGATERVLEAIERILLRNR